MITQSSFCGSRGRNMTIFQLIGIWAVCCVQVASAGQSWSINGNISRAVQAEGATICSRTGRACCDIGFLTPTYTKSQHIMGVVADCSRSTIYISEAAGLRALDVGGRQKWFAPSSGGWGVAVDSSNGNVFVSQYNMGVVQAYNPSGTLVRTIGSTLRGQSGKLGNFYGPTGVAIFRGNLIVADADLNRFQILGTDGAFRSVFGSKGFGDGQFGGSKIGPFGVAVHEASSRLYLADPYVNRLSVWSLSGSEARFERHVGEGVQGGRDVGQLFYPFGVTVHQDSGDIYVLNTNNHRVEVFAGDGGFRRSLGGGQSLKMCNIAARGSTLLSASARPSLEERSRYDGKLMTLGVRFTPRVGGTLAGVRYIKPTGDRLGRRVVVYDYNRAMSVVYEQPLAPDSCEDGDWVSRSFNTGVALKAGQDYVLALTDLESYAATSGGFTPARSQAGRGASELDLNSNTAGASLMSNGQWSFSHTNYWIDAEFFASSAYSPALNAPPPFAFPYAGAFGLDGSFYVGQGLPEPVTDAGCDVWPPPDYTTMFSPGDRATIRELNDGELYAMGVQFSTNTPGTITAVRYYKALGEVGYGHVGKVYDFTGGKLLASTVDFSDAGCAGPAWVSAPLRTPLRTSPGTVYLAAMDNVFSFTKSLDGLEADKDRGPLKLLRHGALYAKAGRMPHIGGWGPHNYWVDVEFTTNTNVMAPPPLSTSTRRPTTSSSGGVVTVTDTRAPSPSPANAARPTTPQSPPTSQGPLTCNWWPSQDQGQGSITFFRGDEQPVLDSATDGSQHTLGIRLRTSVAGDLIAVRYLKPRDEEGSRHHVRILDWDTGELYASVTNVDDAACLGPTWVSVSLTKPLRTKVGATYLVYVDNLLFFPRSDGFFSGPLTRGPLTVLGSSTGAAGYVPWDTYWQATNYWVDVEFSPPGTSPSPRVPAPAPPSSSSAPRVPTPPPTTPARSPVPPPGGNSNTGGGSGGYGCNVWPVSGTQTLFSPSDQPMVKDARDGTKHAFGLRFKTSVIGELTAVRFLKSPGESGASVRVRIIDWATEKQFASTTVTASEADRCSGLSWVSVALQPPVRTSVGTTYLVYVDGVSLFPRSDGFFKGPLTRGPLQALGSSSGQAGYVPWDTYWQATNFWIDVEFVPVGTVVGPPLPAPVPAPVPPPPASRPPSRPPSPSPSPGPPSPGVLVTAQCNTWPRAPFQSLFSAGDLPSLTPQTQGGTPRALGVLLSSREDGDISAVRWFKAAGEGGSGHVGRIYEWATGRQLSSTAPFTDASCGGPRWVSARLSKPLPIRANTQYVVVMDNVRTFVRSDWVLNEDWFSGDLQAHQAGTLSGVVGTMPRNRDFEESCYWVDVEFLANLDKPSASKALPSLAGTGASVGPPLAVTVACNSWPQGPGVETFFSPHDPTPSAPWGDGTPHAVGVRVQPTVAGELRAVRFLRFQVSPEPTWGHSVRVVRWKDGKVLAAVAHVTADHPSCMDRDQVWLSVALDPPVPTAVGEEYVVVVDSLLHLANTAGYFTRPSIRGQLTVLGATWGPAGTDPFGLDRGDANFWIDVEFAPAVPAPPAPASQALPVPSWCSPWPGPLVQTLFTQDDTPDGLDRYDGRPIAIGLRVSVLRPGLLTAVRFYRAAREGGEGHLGRVYDWASGALLASAVGSGDPQCPGPQWVRLPLDQALPLYPGTQYVVAVNNVTYYVRNDNFFTSDRVSSAGQLIGRRNGAVFGSPGAMPQDTTRATSNFWVDLEFER